MPLPMLQPDTVLDSLYAYQLAKPGNALRVRAEAVRWARIGARINAISPGVIVTPMSRGKLRAPSGAAFRAMIETSPAGRAGTRDEVATVGALLLGGRRLHHRQRRPHGRRPTSTARKRRHHERRPGRRSAYRSAGGASRSWTVRGRRVASRQRAGPVPRVAQPGGRARRSRPYAVMSSARRVSTRIDQSNAWLASRTSRPVRVRSPRGPAAWKPCRLRRSPRPRHGRVDIPSRRRVRAAPDRVIGQGVRP